MSYDATDENAIIIRKDDNEPAIVEEEVPSKNVEGDDNSDASWDMVEEENRTSHVEIKDHVKDTDEEPHYDDYVDTDDSDDDDMAALKKVASVRKVQTMIRPVELTAPKESVQIEMVEMKKETALVEAPPVAEEIPAVEEPQENQAMEDTIDSIQTLMCPSCKCIQVETKMETISGDACLVSPVGTERRMSMNLSGQEEDDQSVEVQLWSAENEDAMDVESNEPELESNQTEGPPSILKRASSETPYKIRHSLGLSKTRSVQPRVPRVPKKPTKVFQLARALSVGSSSVMKPNPVQMIRSKSVGPSKTNVKNSKTVGPSKTNVKKSTSSVRKAITPKLPRGISSEDNKKADFARSTSTPANDFQRPMQLRKARTANSVAWQSPVQSSLGDRKTKKMSSSSIGGPVSEELKIQSVGNSKTDEGETTVNSIDLSSKTSKDTTKESDLEEKRDTKKCPPPEARDDEDVPNDDNGSVLTNGTSATGGSEMTTKAGNVTVRKLQVFGSSVRRVSEEECSRMKSPSKIKKSKRKKNLKMSKGLGKGSETFKMKPTKQSNQVIKPAQIKSSNERKKGISWKLW